MRMRSECAAKEIPQDVRPLIEFRNGNALAVAVRGVHVSRSYDDDLPGYASEACGLRTKADAGRLAAQQSCELVGKRRGWGAVEAGFIPLQIEVNGDSRHLLRCVVDELTQCGRDGAGQFAGDCAPLEEKRAFAGKDVFCRAPGDDADVEGGRGRVKERMRRCGLQGVNTQDDIRGGSDGGDAFAWEGRVSFAAAECDAGKRVTFTCYGGTKAGRFADERTFHAKVGPDGEQAIHAFASDLLVCGKDEREAGIGLR